MEEELKRLKEVCDNIGEFLKDKTIPYDLYLLEGSDITTYNLFQYSLLNNDGVNIGFVKSAYNQYYITYESDNIEVSVSEINKMSMRIDCTADHLREAIKRLEFIYQRILSK